MNDERPTPQRIAVFQTDHLGDAILFSGAWRHLRARFPNARITLIGGPMALELLRLCPHIDQFLDFRPLLPSRWMRWWPFPRKKFETDMVLAPSRSVSRRRIDLLRSIRFREAWGLVGEISDSPAYHRRETQWKKLITHAVPLSPDFRWRHELAICARFLSELGCAVRSEADVLPEVWLSDAHRTDADAALAPLEGRPFGVLMPGATGWGEVKSWPPERYAQTAVQLGDQGPPAWVLDGGPGDRPVCAEVADALRRAAPHIVVLNLTSSPLMRMAAILERARIALATDNGGLHLATALRIPTIGLRGGWHKHRHYPWGDPQIHHDTSRPIPCEGCGFHCSQPTVHCMENLTVEMVVAECRSVLSAAASRAPS